MIEKPMDVLQQFPVRKSKKQKQAFRDAVGSYIRSLGYECTVEKGSAGSQNIVIGDAEKAKYLVTAHYDTCAGMIVPNLITPCNLVTFLAYQIFVSILLLVPGFALGAVVMHLTQDALLGYWITLACLYLAIIMLIAGPANKRNANDNTSGVVTVLEIAASMPQNLRDRVCFVLFDLEEAGLFGSASYRKAHKKATQNQIVLNLDCVGDGDTIMFFPTKKLKKDQRKLERLQSLERECGDKRVVVRHKGFAIYPSDQANFPYGVGIAALHKGKLGYYLGQIHTRRDTILEMTNVNILRACLTSFIAGNAAE